MSRLFLILLILMVIMFAVFGYIVYTYLEKAVHQFGDEINKLSNEVIDIREDEEEDDENDDE